MRADDGERAERADGEVGEMHRTPLAAAQALRLAEDLRHRPVERRAHREHRAVTAVRARTRVAPHRRDRLCGWMRSEDVPCTVLFGADHVAHLTGYARYFGGPSALVVGVDGRRVLVVMQDEAPVAREGSSADEVIGFGERGFGIDLDPVAGLVATVAALPDVARAKRLGMASELADAGLRLAGLLDATLVDAGETLRRIRLVKDWEELEK